jgi:phenylacetate-CoA ligase
MHFEHPQCNAAAGSPRLTAFATMTLPPPAHPPMHFHPGHWLHRRRYPERYDQLDRLIHNLALSREQLLARQQVDYAAILAHAAAHVPYYSERLQQAGVVPALTKDQVRERLDDLLSDDADRSQVKLGHTSGSTGKPLAFWYDEHKHELMRAGMMRGFMMSGWQPGQKVLNFWGARQDVAAGGVFGLGSTWADWIAAEKTIGATEFTEAKLQQWARFVQQYQPVLLYGYPSAMSELARYILAERLVMPRSLIGVYSTAEMLSDTQRDLMQQAFGCKVFNQYGCREVPNIAWECRHGNMHVFADLVRLESERIDGEDQLIVTSLTNRLMPFIRYQLGDSGRLLDGECACGSPFPLMEMGLCRQNDLIRTRTGKRIHPGFFHHLLDGQTQVQQFQWVQRALDRIELNVVTAQPLDASVQAALTETLCRKLEDRVTLLVNHVAEIPRTLSGKHRFVIGLDKP